MSNSQLLFEAKSALRENNRDKAWRILHKYVSTVPDDIEAWLMLGALAKPESSLNYFRIAERIDSQDSRVRKAIEWAEERNKEAAPEAALYDDEKTSPHHISQEISPEKNQGEIQSLESAGEQGKHVVREKITGDIEDKKAQKTPSKAVKVLKYIGLGIFILVIIVLLTIGITSRIKGTAPQIFGRRFIIVTSGSMEPTFYTGSIIVVDTREGQTHELDDVITFWTADDPDLHVTHRIVDITVDEGIRYYQTRGDNNDADDFTLITDENIIGEYTGITIPLLGYFFSFIKSRNGILLIIFLFGLYLVITQAFRIKSLMAEDKKA